MKQQVKVIKTQRDYDASVVRLSALMDEEIAPGSSKESELELLALVIKSYERSKVDPVVPDPIEAILFRMDQLGLKKVNMVPYMGLLPKVSEVLARKRPLNLAMIRKLHLGLGIPADVLLVRPMMRLTIAKGFLTTKTSSPSRRCSNAATSRAFGEHFGKPGKTPEN